MILPIWMLLSSVLFAVMFRDPGPDELRRRNNGVVELALNPQARDGSLGARRVHQLAHVRLAELRARAIGASVGALLQVFLDPPHVGVTVMLTVANRLSTEVCVRSCIALSSYLELSSLHSATVVGFAEATMTGF